MENMEACKRRFVELLVKQGANVQQDQQVLIASDPSCIELVEMAAEFCYERGARYVDTKITVPRLARHHVLMASPDRLNYVPTYQTVQMDQLVDSGGALIAFRSQDEPDLYEDFDEDQQKQLNTMLIARRRRSDGIGRRGSSNGRLAGVFPARQVQNGPPKSFQNCLRMRRWMRSGEISSG